MKRQVGSIHYSKSFEKDLRKAPADIKKAWVKRLTLFIGNPTHPHLHNHSLSGKYIGYRSINVNGDWRAVYAEQSNGKHLEIIALFQAIGTHSQLYK